MTSSEIQINSLTIEKYIVTMYKRENPRQFTHCPFLVELKQMTPKAKYNNCKIHWRYVYRTEAEAIEKMFSTHNNIEANIKSGNDKKEAQRKANAEVKASDFYKVGDVICNSWGYEQTNIDWYQVVKVGNKTIEIKEIHGAQVEGTMMSHGMACDVVAVIDDFKENGDEFTLRVKEKGRLSNPKSFYYMHKWDGRPTYQSWYY